MASDRLIADQNRIQPHLQANRPNESAPMKDHSLHHTPIIPSFVIAGLLVGCTPTEKAEPDSRSENTPTGTLRVAEFDGWSLTLDALR